MIDVDKELIGLLPQAIGLALILWVIKRQLNDLFIKDSPREQFTKYVLFGGAAALAFIYSMGFVRLLHVVLEGHSMGLLDMLTFWSNRVAPLVNGVTGFALYRGNKRELRRD